MPKAEQKIVDSDVKEIIDTAEYSLQSFIDIWNILPLGIQVFLSALFVTSIVMQSIKKTLLVKDKNGTKYRKEERFRLLRIYGFFAGLLVTLSGYLFTNGAELEMVWWAGIGICVSTVAMWIHRFTIDILLPFIGAIGKPFADRIYLFVTGKPRDDKNAS